MASPTAMARSTTASELCSARITSSSGISGGGLKKCMPTTFSGRAAAPASEVTGIEEVFVASTTSSPHTIDSAPKRSRFSSARSGAASITSSQGASSSSVLTGSSSSAAPASTRPFSAHFASPRRADSAPRSSASGIGS